jgi:glycosyltransferase involved in cell wall biosynthesis
MQRGKSGVGQYIIALTRAMIPHAARHEFTLFVLEEDLPHFSFAATKMRISPVAERHRPPVRNILWHQSRLPGLVKKVGADVLHIPSYRRMLWRKPCTLVTTIHDLAPFRVPGKYDAMRMLYGRVACRALARRQDRIIAVSRAASSDITRFFGVAPEGIEVIPNGLDHGRFSPGSRAAARAAVCAPAGITQPFFLYVARLEHPAKNHAGLIDAFETFKDATGSDWKLVLAGGDWHGADVIRRLARDSRHARDIVLLGFVSNSDLPDWYRAADVFVFPSHFEGFGLPPVEAMACACPVLSSGAGALEETVGGACGSLDPASPRQMAAQLTRAVSDPRWLGELRLAGLQRASEFSWEACASSTLGVYQAAVGVNSLSNRHNGAGTVSSLSSGDLHKDNPSRPTMPTNDPTKTPASKGMYSR